MAVAASDIALLLSGGAANTDPLAALGGAASATNVVAGGLNSIFRDITASEAATGITLYRCLYLQNNNVVDTATNIVLHIETLSTSLSSATSMGVGTAAVNGTEQIIASETTAPAGVVLTAPTAFASAVALGDLGPGETRSLWVALAITAGAGFQSPDAVTWRFTFNP